MFSIRRYRKMSFSNLVLVALLAFSQAEGVWSRTRIVNGVHAKLGEFPFQIVMTWNGAQQCGGSILNENYILTAAHCVDGLKPETLKVLAGVVDVDNPTEKLSKHNVSKITVHEDYDADESWDNDIAVMKIDPPFVFNDVIAPATLPDADEDYKDVLAVKVSGFGRTSRYSKSSTKLLKTELYIINRDYCQKAMDKIYETIRETNVCAVNLLRTTGFCSGDSGGPLSIEGKVIGLVSFGSYGGCANDVRDPMAFTRVSKYIDWIAENMKN